MFPHQGSIRSGVRCHSATVTQPARLGGRPRPGACADTGSPGVSHPAGCTDAASCKLPGSCSEGTPAQARGATMQLGPSASGRTELPEHCALHLGRTKRMQPVSEDRIGGLPEAGERKGQCQWGIQTNRTQQKPDSQPPHVPAAFPRDSSGPAGPALGRNRGGSALRRENPRCRGGPVARPVGQR